MDHQANQIAFWLQLPASFYIQSFIVWSGFKIGYCSWETAVQKHTHDLYATFHM